VVLLFLNLTGKKVSLVQSWSGGLLEPDNRVEVFLLERVFFFLTTLVASDHTWRFAAFLSHVDSVSTNETSACLAVRSQLVYEPEERFDMLSPSRNSRGTRHIDNRETCPAHPNNRLT